MPAPAPASAALPTLLTSRPQLRSAEKSAAKGRGAPAPPQKLPEAYPNHLRVRNTFIDTSAERSPSLERFYQEREVSTCPSAHIGRLKSLFQDVDASSGGNDDDREPQPPSSAPQARCVREASPDSAASPDCGMPQACVLSLAAALSPPYLPAPAAAWGDQIAYGGNFADSATYAMEVPCDGTFSFEYSWTEVPQARVVVERCLEEIPADAYHCVGVGGGAVRAVDMPMPLLGADLQDVPAPPDRPAPGSAELPSVGSSGHAAGGCKPCAFFHTVGCANGLTCQFCHLCDPEERKRRRKAKYEARRTDKLRRSALAAGGQQQESSK